MERMQLPYAYKLPICVIAWIVLSGLLPGYSQPIAQWRGVDRTGIYEEDNLLEAWPEEGPELLWVYEGIGRGFGSAAISNNKIFINGEIDGIGYLFAFDLEGNLLWKSPNGPEFVGSGLSATYPGARSTPTVVGDRIYATSGKGRIACFNAANGDEIWAKDKNRDLGGRGSEFGYSESVVVDEDKLYCFPGGQEINMAALNRFTGEFMWTSKVKQDTFSYCSPIRVVLPTREILISTSRHYLFAIDCADGELLASYELEGFEWDGEHCNTPLYADDHIYFIGNDDEGKGAIKLALSQNGESMEEIWYNRKIRNNFGGFIHFDNLLFTTIKGNWLKALELERGLVADSIRVPDGSLIFADHKFICYGTSGTVSLVNYSRNKLEVTGAFKIKTGTGHHFSHPVLADGIMYIRHGDALMAFKISKNH